MVAQLRAGIDDPAASLLRQHGRRAAGGLRPLQLRPARDQRRQHGQQGAGRRHHALLPVYAPGALFEVGDGHAGQGNGEVDITAIETSLTGTLQFIVRKDLKLTYPRAETPTHYIAMGMDPDLNGDPTSGAARNAILCSSRARQAETS